MARRILVAAPVPDAVAERAVREFGAILSQDRVMTPEEMVAAAIEHKLQGLLVTSRVRIGAEAIAALPDSVKVMATFSVGYDHIDVAAAAARGLIVTNTPDVLTEATADLTMMLMLCACRRAAEYHEIMKAGWGYRFQLNEMLGIEVSGKRLGIAGMGRIGRAVARRARGFGMQILYHNPRRLAPELEQDAVYYSDFHAMLADTQILTLHAPGGAQSDNMVDAAAIARLPRGAVVVNAARGQLIDEDALIVGLQSGHVAAAGLDVFRREPDYDKRFRDLPNAFLTPHMGSATFETRNAMGHRALANIEAVLSTGRPIDAVP